MTVQTPYLLEMTGINKEFPGVRALDGVSLHVSPGEIHALVGENGAGKSTLMKILTGTYRPDGGTIILRGKPVEFRNPHQARAAGISMIHQELNLVPEMSAAQNIFLGTDAAIRRFGVISRRERERLAVQALEELNLSIDVTIPVRKLSIAHQQMIEIAKALSIKSDLLVMDEPTSSLSDREIESLYEVIFALKKRGVSIIYISHRLEEIFDLSDRVTVLRDGRNVGTEVTKNLTMNNLVRMMVGRDLEHFFRQRTQPGAGLWSATEAEQSTYSLLSRCPEVRGIYAANDTMALGVLNALAHLQRQDDIIVVGTDGTPSALRAIREKRLAATVATFGYDYGRIGLELAIRALEGQPLPKRLPWPAVLVTAENVADFSPAARLSALREASEFHASYRALGPLPAPAREYQIGVVLKTLRNEHWQEMKRGYEDAAAAHGVRVQIVAADSETDGREQLTRTEALIESGCDALCVSPITATNLLPAINRAAQMNIPIINVDDAEITGAAITTVLTADQEAIGTAAAAFLDPRIPAGATAMMIGGLPTSPAARSRRQGFLKGERSARVTRAADCKAALQVENLSTYGNLKNVSFTAYWGEILGIAGLVGSGRTELVRAIFGADPIRSGTTYIEGKRVSITSPHDAIELGIGLVPEDRKAQGLILEMPVLNNSTLTILDRVSRWGVLRRKTRQQIADEYVRKLTIKTPSLKQTAKYLSGGNQQKVVVAKWLASQARILIFDEPTRGIDVGAKVEVRALMDELAREGVCVILISSEMPEILGMCDRIMVMHEGQMVGEFDASWATEEEILHAASGLTIESRSS